MKSLKSKKGSSLILVTIIATAVGLIVASLISSALTERKVNYRNELRYEAQNAAAAVLEYGLSQVSYKFKSRTNLTTEALAPGSSDALSLPTADLLSANVNLSEIELVGGTVPIYPNTLYYIDPDDPNNEFDPLKGKRAYVREVEVYGKASVTDPKAPASANASYKEMEVYATQRLQIRDSPLFAHAIFYNLDLELHPGPVMNVYGPVHTNGTLWAQAVNSLKFHNQVTTSEHYRYGHKAQGIENSQNGNVYFKDRDDNFLSSKIDGTYYDAYMGGTALDDDFREFASSRWNGNLITKMHDVPKYDPVNFSSYEEDDPITPSYDPVNSGRSIIEPAITDTIDPEYDTEIESQKMANKAGLRFVWDTATNTVTAYRGDGTLLDISNLEGDPSDSSDDADSLFEYKANLMKDHRRNQTLDTVDINVGKLKQLIENPDTGDAEKHIGNFDPDLDWNGIVYFECVSSNSNAAAAQALDYTGIRLWGGDTDESGQGIPSRGTDPGMTFATNNALYIKGNFNADGVLHQESSSEHSAIEPEAGEVPVAVMGDTVTFISDIFDEASSHTTKNPNAPSAGMEVAVGIVAGIVPSNAEGNNKLSGGAHNFPRFLEKWSGKDFFIRGSLVCLYESEVDRGTYGGGYYSPPNRKWGFSEQYREGVYPPGTPLLRDMVRVDYRTLNKTEYETAIASLPWSTP
ncbi:hypothetical protein MLD52_08415 [Puniceicoccaceae bacterium K14]|nr:hypothetical protein [Puniceicoccaceae bacterium K14]